METPICPISTRLEDSKYPIDSSVKSGDRIYGVISTVINIPKDSSTSTEEPEP
jgi:hypothetical protein